MAEVLVSTALKELMPAIAQEAKQMVAVEKDLQKLERTLETIKRVLPDAENIQFKDESIRGYLRELKEVAYDMEEVLDEWNTSIQKQQLETSILWKKVCLFFTSFYDNTSILCKKVCLFFTSSCDCLGLRHDSASKIKEIKKKLDEIKQQNLFNLNGIKRNDADLWKERSTTTYTDENKVRGRDEDKKLLVNMLLSESSKGGKGFHVISLVGMGGIGKTTLARSVYKIVDEAKSFDKIAWVCVSEPFDKFRVANHIIQQLTGLASNLSSLQCLLEVIEGNITGKKFLLVLDDVWTKDTDDLAEFLLCLDKGATGSKILVTTRNKEVAHVFKSDIIFVKKLPENECWLLFCQLALCGSSECDHSGKERIGKEIVAKCKGLPLAVKTVGSLLSCKGTTDKWQSILKSEIWKLEFRKGPFRPLLLSYNDLPFMVKRCFLYCAVFPKDYTMDKDDLIKLWMAHGYLDSTYEPSLEVTGDEYFNILANRSFFDEFKKDDNKITCKMHDIIHDFAQYLNQNECFAVEVNGDGGQRVLSSYENARHMTVLCYHKISFSGIFPRSKKLRSLLSLCKYHISISNALNQVTSLRALKLEEDESIATHLESTVEIPKEIEKLILLRYLDVSKNGRLQELPEALCELYNLQTLNIRSCHALTALPQGIGKLINLRHLMNGSCFALSYMPKGIERLTNLRTLDEFVVSDDNPADEASTLASLKSLEHLQGKLKIKRLGNVRNMSEAQEAQLHSKTKLTVLDLRFDESEYIQQNRAKHDELLLEALLPSPTNLQGLHIYSYRGRVISPICLTSLTQLRDLCINSCGNMESLPPLGILPSLESLTIARMEGVRDVDRKWLGIQSGMLPSSSSSSASSSSITLEGMERVENVGRECLGTESGMPTSSSSASSSSITAFPKLTSLKFSDMPEWDYWDYRISGKQEDIHIMPSLRSLQIQSCRKLEALPDHLLHDTSLKELKISLCPLYSYLKKRGQDWPLNVHIPQIYYDGYGDKKDYGHYKSVIDAREHKFYFVKGR